MTFSDDTLYHWDIKRDYVFEKMEKFVPVVSFLTYRSRHTWDKSTVIDVMPGHKIFSEIGSVEDYIKKNKSQGDSYFVNVNPSIQFDFENQSFIMYSSLNDKWFSECDNDRMRKWLTHLTHGDIIKAASNNFPFLKEEGFRSFHVKMIKKSFKKLSEYVHISRDLGHGMRHALPLGHYRRDPVHGGLSHWKPIDPISCNISHYNRIICLLGGGGLRAVD